jgi:hypothetical protein
MQSSFSPSITQDLRNIFQLSDERINEISSKYPESGVTEVIQIIRDKLARKEKIPNLITCLREYLAKSTIRNSLIVESNPYQEICGAYSREVKKVLSPKEVKKENLNGNTVYINQYLEAQQDPTWRSICELLLKEIGEKVFKAWICQICFVGIKDGKYIILKASTSCIRDYVKNNYGSLIEEIARRFIPTIKWIEMED